MRYMRTCCLSVHKDQRIGDRDVKGSGIGDPDVKGSGTGDPLDV